MAKLEANSNITEAWFGVKRFFAPLCHTGERRLHGIGQA